MRMEAALVRLVDAVRQKDVKPERLARIFELTLEKVSESSPAGPQALQLVQTRFLKNALRTELTIVPSKHAKETVAKKPRKRRRTALEMAVARAKETKEGNKEKRGPGRPRLNKATALADAA